MGLEYLEIIIGKNKHKCIVEFENPNENIIYTYSKFLKRNSINDKLMINTSKIEEWYSNLNKSSSENIEGIKTKISIDTRVQEIRYEGDRRNLSERSINRVCRYKYHIRFS